MVMEKWTIKSGNLFHHSSFAISFTTIVCLVTIISFYLFTTPDWSVTTIWLNYRFDPSLVYFYLTAKFCYIPAVVRWWGGSAQRSWWCGTCGNRRRRTKGYVTSCAATHLERFSEMPMEASNLLEFLTIGRHWCKYEPVWPKLSWKVFFNFFVQNNPQSRFFTEWPILSAF